MKESIFLTLLMIFLLSGCTAAPLNQYNMVTAFSPHIGKDGSQSFTFIANKNFPTYGSNQTPQEIHENIISSELGKRQFCMKSYDIQSQVEQESGMIIYTGKCK